MKKAKNLLAAGIIGMAILSISGCGWELAQKNTGDGIMDKAEVSTKALPVSGNAGQDIQEKTERDAEKMSRSVHMAIDDRIYAVKLDDNKTTRDIIQNMPLNLSMVRYAGHEYYSKLSFVPELADTRTSYIQAGHVYYWDGWNALVINYEDYDISPYQVVHIGEILDTGVSLYLRQAADAISISVRE